MTNHNTLFYKIMTFTRDGGFRFQDIRIAQTFIWAVVGLIESGKPHYSHWLVYRKGKSQAASKARQFSRWLHNKNVSPLKLYLPFVARLVEEWEMQTMYLALDTTQLWKRFVVVRLALVYCGRAIPLGWVVLESGSATVGVARYRQMLEQVAAVLPSKSRKILLADRGFGHIELFEVATELGWHFRIRLKSDTWVCLSNGQRRQIRSLMPPLGKGRCYPQVWLTQRQYGPLHLAVAQVITPKGAEKWAIASDETVGRQTFDEYGLRFNIEENFRDDKSGGFHLANSRLEEAQAISRLCLILATATVYLVVTGVAVTTLGFRPVVDTHWRRGLSFFQIGWRWYKHAKAQAKWLLSFVWLPPFPDPEPVIASWKQFHEPMFELHELEWL